jgi:hypothetical protein
MAMDLDTLTVPDNPHDEGREMFDPINAWPDASSRIFVAVHRAGPKTIYQFGYDPEHDTAWTRLLDAAGVWGAWNIAGLEPAPSQSQQQ